MTKRAKALSDSQVLPMLTNESIYMGVDIGKFKNVAGFLARTLVERHQHFENCPAFLFEQSREGFRAFVERIRAYCLGDKTNLQYRTATLDNINAEIDLAALNFGRKRAEATREARLRFMETNPEITHYLYANDRIVASINLIPLTHDAIFEFQDGKRGWQFNTHQIEQFAPNRRLECIIIDMMTTTKVALDQRFRYASYLLRDFAHITLAEWAKRGVDIATIDACAGTEDGERILKRAGFEYLGKRDERDIYHLDIDKSDLPLLKTYKETLNKWKQEHSTNR